jgi:hypothetical protein
MSVVPKKFADRIQFFQERITLWTTNATAIGTTAAEVTALGAQTQAARDAFEAQRDAQNAAKAATEALKQAVATMSNSGAAIIEQVRTKARSAGPGVYPLAQIPVPATPAPAGPPGKASDFTAELTERGELNLKWKCANPVGTTGTVYQIWRRDNGGQAIYLGGCGTKEFVDRTIPAGVNSIVYEIQAVRSTALGPWATFNVVFGTGGGMSVTETTVPKLAA